MMEAVPIILDRAYLVERAEVAGTGILAKTIPFTKFLAKLGYKSPAGAAAGAAGTEARFRVYLTVPDYPKLNAVYYVSGWLDEGYVHLERDSDQVRIQGDRRAAVAATKAKIS